MTRCSPRLAILFAALLSSAIAIALALEPFTLGSIFKLGTSESAATLPASSGTTAGGLIYTIVDAGVLFNNGNAWVDLSLVSNAHRGLLTIGGGGTVTQTVLAGAVCTCSYTSIGVVILTCPVVATTMTVTGSIGATVAYTCL